MLGRGNSPRQQECSQVCCWGKLQGICSRSGILLPTYTTVQHLKKWAARWPASKSETGMVGERKGFALGFLWTVPCFDICCKSNPYFASKSSSTRLILLFHNFGDVHSFCLFILAPFSCFFTLMLLNWITVMNQGLLFTSTSKAWPAALTG